MQLIETDSVSCNRIISMRKHDRSYINPREKWAICILTRSPKEKLAKKVGNFGSFGKANLEQQYDILYLETLEVANFGAQNSTA